MCAKGMLLQHKLAIDVGSGFMGGVAQGGQAAMPMPGAVGEVGGGPRGWGLGV